LAWQEVWHRLEKIARGVLPAGQTLDAASAEDLVQQVLVKLLESPERLDRLDPSLSPEAYLKTAVHNAARDLARRKVLALKALKHLVQERLSCEPMPSSSSERLVALAEELEALPEEQRTLLRMRFWEGRSLSEIAQHLGEGYSTVAVRLFRLLKKLKSRLPLL
jgi:RNA polymerase sigma-70 factor (ECF subfamily)